MIILGDRMHNELSERAYDELGQPVLTWSEKLVTVIDHVLSIACIGLMLGGIVGLGSFNNEPELFLISLKVLIIGFVACLLLAAFRHVTRNVRQITDEDLDRAEYALYLQTGNRRFKSPRKV